MPKALTIEEKVARAHAPKVAKVADVIATAVEKGAVPKRPRKGAFNGTEGKLNVNGSIPGYHMHILNDYPGRIDTALSNGYEFVTPDEIDGVGVNVVSRNTDIGDKIRFLVGKNDQGLPLYAYLMKIRQEWYDEDLREQQQKVDVIDDAIRRGKTPGTTPEGFYVPKDGIKMST